MSKVTGAAGVRRSSERRAPATKSATCMLKLLLLMVLWSGATAQNVTEMTGTKIRDHCIRFPGILEACGTCAGAVAAGVLKLDGQVEANLDALLEASALSSGDGKSLKDCEIAFGDNTVAGANEKQFANIYVYGDQLVSMEPETCATSSDKGGLIACGECAPYVDDLGKAVLEAKIKGSHDFSQALANLEAKEDNLKIGSCEMVLPMQASVRSPYVCFDYGSSVAVAMENGVEGQVTFPFSLHGAFDMTFYQHLSKASSISVPQGVTTTRGASISGGAGIVKVKHGCFGSEHYRLEIGDDVLLVSSCACTDPGGWSGFSFDSN